MTQSLSKPPSAMFPTNSTVSYEDILGLCEGVLCNTVNEKENGKILVRIGVKDLDAKKRKLLAKIPAINPGSEISILYLFNPSEIVLVESHHGRQTQGKTTRRSK